MHIGGFFNNSLESVSLSRLRPSSSIVVDWIFYHVYVKRKLTFLRALCELDNLMVRVYSLCLNGHRNAVNYPVLVIR